MLTGCREYRQRLIELARGSVAANERRNLMAHVAECADCARALEGQLALSATLERMAGEALPEMAAIEAHVLAEFDRHAARRVVPIRWALVAGLAAAVLMGLVWVERPKSQPRQNPKVETVAAETRPPAPAPVPAEPPAAPARTGRPVQRVNHALVHRPAREPEQPFLTIPYTVPLGPGERTTEVRMEIPVAALIAAGFRVPVKDAGSVVEADVLVSEDGRARAIRPVGIAASR